MFCSTFCWCLTGREFWLRETRVMSAKQIVDSAEKAKDSLSWFPWKIRKLDLAWQGFNLSWYIYALITDWELPCLISCFYFVPIHPPLGRKVHTSWHIFDKYTFEKCTFALLISSNLGNVCTLLQIHLQQIHFSVLTHLFVYIARRLVSIMLYCHQSMGYFVSFIQLLNEQCLQVDANECLNLLFGAPSLIFRFCKASKL